MSDAAAATPAGGGAASGGGGGSNKLLLIIVLVFNVLIAAGLGYQVLMGQGKGAAGQIKPGDHGGEHGDGKDGAGPSFGPLIEVGSMVANMSGPLSGHYAKVFVHVEAADETAKPRVEAALVPIRSEVLLFFSNLDLKDATGQDQIRALAEELKTKLNTLVGKDTIKRVYFSEFVIQ
jgi:flagellar FliL protein